MPDKSCDCYSEAEADTFFDDILSIFIRGGALAVFACTTSYLIDKTNQHGDEIEELFSRLEECEENHESSQDS